MVAIWPKAALGAMWLKFNLGAVCPRPKVNLSPT